MNMTTMTACNNAYRITKRATLSTSIFILRRAFSADSMAYSVLRGVSIFY